MYLVKSLLQHIRIKYLLLQFSLSKMVKLIILTLFMIVEVIGKVST